MPLVPGRELSPLTTAGGAWREERNAPSPFFALAGLALALATTPATAGQHCAKRDTVVGYLAQKYRESPVAIGVTREGALFEVLTDAKVGTWTAIVTTPEGMSCLIAAGDGWQQLNRVVEGPAT